MKICINPRKSVVINNKYSFMLPKLEMKYFPFIQNKINKKYVEKYIRYRYKDTGMFRSINEVIKKEERYDPFE
jgi:hypothetical protein